MSLTRDQIAEMEAKAKQAVTWASLEAPSERAKILTDDFPALVAELRRLKDKYEGKAPRCNGGHENTLPIALWDCPTCTEVLRGQLKAAEYLLIERARQADELMGQVMKAEQERDQALALAAELRVELTSAIEVCAGGRKVNIGEAGNCRVPQITVNQIDHWLRALSRTPVAALALQQARRAVVEAVRRWRTAERGLARFNDDASNQTEHEMAENEFLAADEAVGQAFDALKALEARG